MKVFEQTLGKSKEVILIISLEEAKELLEVYEFFVSKNPRRTRIKATTKLLYASLPIL